MPAHTTTYFCKKCNRDATQTKFYKERRATCSECYKKEHLEAYNKQKELKQEFNFENVPTYEFIDESNKEIIKEFNSKFDNLVSQNLLLLTKINSLEDKVRFLEDEIHKSRTKSPSPVRTKSPSPVRTKSPSPVRTKSPSPVRILPLTPKAPISDEQRERINNIIKKINYYNIKELTAFCREFNVHGYSAKPKDVLIKLLVDRLNKILNS
jgi:hypothetical protein